MKTALLFGGMLLLVADQSMIACSDHPASKNYWSWREIQNRKCWYQGHRMIDKSMLYWPTHAVDVRVSPAKPRESTEQAVAVTTAEESKHVMMVATRRSTAFEWIWRNLIIDMNARVWMDPTRVEEWRMP